MRRCPGLRDRQAEVLETASAAASEITGKMLAIPGVDRVGAMSYIRAPFAGPKSRANYGGDAGWSSPVARQAHNLKVPGSNPGPATKFIRARASRQLGEPRALYIN